jgi:hypothetical protein
MVVPMRETQRERNKQKYRENSLNSGEDDDDLAQPINGSLLYLSTSRGILGNVYDVFPHCSSLFVCLADRVPPVQLESSVYMARSIPPPPPNQLCWADFGGADLFDVLLGPRSVRPSVC